MKLPNFLRIDLSPIRFYGLLLGVFWFGLQRKGMMFEIVHGRVLKDGNTIYGLGFGTKLYGLGTWVTPVPQPQRLYGGLIVETKPVSKYTIQQLKEALTEIAIRKNPATSFASSQVADSRSILDLVKYDSIRQLSPALLKQAEDFIEGNLEIPEPPPLQQELLNTKHNLESTAAISESTKKSRVNLAHFFSREEWRAARYPKVAESDYRDATDQLNALPLSFDNVKE